LIYFFSNISRQQRIYILSRYVGTIFCGSNVHLELENPKQFRGKMFAKGKSNRNRTNVPRPNFVTIGNLYDQLFQLTKEYGFEKVILHLGDIAKNTVSRELAGRIWGILRMTNRVDSSTSDTDD